MHLNNIFTFIYKLDSFFYNFFYKNAPLSEQQNFFYKHFQNEQIDSFFHFITKFGEGYLELILAFFIICISLFQKYKNHKKNPFKFFILFFYNQLFIQLTVNILKILFGRLRPYVSPHPNGFFGIFYLIKNNLLFDSHYFSFPSGHTITIWGTIWFLFFNYKNKIKYILFPLGILVGISRIYLGFHWFSDVMASVILSYIIVRILNRYLVNK